MHKDAPPPQQQQQQQQAKAKPEPSNTSFDFSPHGGVTFKENPNLNLQMVGTGYGGDDSHAPAEKPRRPRRWATMAFKASRPSSDLRSRATERLLRLLLRKAAEKPPRRVATWRA